MNTDKRIYIFDLGGVLINLNVSRCMGAFVSLMGEANMCAVLGMDTNGEGRLVSDDSQAVDNVVAVSVASKQLMADFERGLISKEKFVEGVLEYSRPGTTAEQVIEAWMAMLDELPQERLDFIDRLRASGHPVYLLSNGNDLHFEYINERYGLERHFDRMFLSQEMHLAKPEEAIYRAVSEAIGEGDIVFIDDLEVNRKSAEKHVGWTTFSSIDDLISHQRERLTRRFHKACADYGLIEDGDHILIGLSGGKDSLALTELLGRRAKIYKPRFKVTALHVRVKERDYRTDLSYLEHFCQEAGVELVVRDVEITNEGVSGLPNERVANTNPCFLCSWYRRKTLFNVAQELGCNKIAFGHHKNDIVQTLLMNLLYAGSFATMPPLLQLDKMPLQIIRPLCLIEETDLIRYATMRGYEKQPKLCPFEHVSAREKVKDLLAQMQELNPFALDTLYNATTNIKTEYLPSVESLKFKE